MIRVRNNAVLTTPASFTANATIIPFDTTDINTNSATALSQNAVQMSVAGVYDTVCVVNISNSGSAAVDEVMRVYADGEAVPGAAVSVTVPASGSVEIALPWTINVINANSGIAAVSWYLSGSAVVLDNVYAEVKRLV